MQYVRRARLATFNCATFKDRLCEMSVLIRTGGRRVPRRTRTTLPLLTNLARMMWQGGRPLSGKALARFSHVVVRALLMMRRNLHPQLVAPGQFGFISDSRIASGSAVRRDLKCRLVSWRS